MPQCPNCGRKDVITEHWYCPWCGYPMLSRSYAKARAKREAQEAKRAKQDKGAKKQAEEVEIIVQDIGAEVYDGEVQLVLKLQVNSKQLKQFKEHLRKVEDLEILWTGWSSSESSIIAVSLQEPLNLLHFLNGIPMAAKAYNKGKKSY